MGNTEKLAEAKASIDAIRPRPYNLDDPAELRRLHRECSGYLRTCHSKHGTDWEGRKFAMDALEQLCRAQVAARPTAAAEGG